MSLVVPRTQVLEVVPSRSRVRLRAFSPSILFNYFQRCVLFPKLSARDTVLSFQATAQVLCCVVSVFELLTGGRLRGYTCPLGDQGATNPRHGPEGLGGRGSALRHQIRTVEAGVRPPTNRRDR